MTLVCLPLLINLLSATFCVACGKPLLKTKKRVRTLGEHALLPRLQGFGITFRRWPAHRTGKPWIAHSVENAFPTQFALGHREQTCSIPRTQVARSAAAVLLFLQPSVVVDEFVAVEEGVAEVGPGVVGVFAAFEELHTLSHFPLCRGTTECQVTE